MGKQNGFVMSIIKHECKQCGAVWHSKGTKQPYKLMLYVSLNSVINMRCNKCGSLKVNHIRVT
jgi:uncharacterized Zn finger protein